MKLAEKRREIDAIDRSIVDLLNRRAAVAREIFLEKMAGGLPITDRQRESEILAEVISGISPSSDANSVERIYRLILQESKLIQIRMRDEVALYGGRK
jgi:chorismate mutase